MALNTVYSFQDVSQSFIHSSVGQYLTTGEGIGSITVAMAQDKAVQDVAADGAVMTSWIAGNNGTISISIQQTSPYHAFLLKVYNYINGQSTLTSEKAMATFNLKALSTGDEISAKGVTIQKLPDRPYQAQGQQVTWVLLAAEIYQFAPTSTTA